MVTKRRSPSRAVNSGVSPSVLKLTLEMVFEGLGRRDLSCQLGSAAGKGYSGDFPSLSGGPLRFGVEYLASEVLSKFDDGKPSPEKEAHTWERFWQAEALCASANERIRISNPDWHSTSSRGVWSLIEAAKRKISRCLGPFDPAEVMDGAGFGPGATTRLPRRKSHLVYKFSGFPETTAANASFAIECISSIPLWWRAVHDDKAQGIKLTLGNRVVTVPKNYKTDRTIAIEPDLNIFVQKGIGAMIRRRLRRVGVDLNDQTHNQKLALIGSLGHVEPDLATIDLSMASDCVSWRLVYELLPSDWFEALEHSRSPEGVLPSREVVTYEKFSSMGNGYTFELESLIFWALAESVTEAYGVTGAFTGVYGDDIVVPAAAAEPLIHLLGELGFRINEKKTFISGPFRESCGKHYFSGVDVTPFYVRRPIQTLDQLFLFHNNLRRWFWRMEAGVDYLTAIGKLDDAEIQFSKGQLVELEQKVSSFVRSFAPSNWRKPRIPDGFGDGAFIGTFDECTPRYTSSFPRKGRGWDGFMIPVMTEKFRTREVCHPARLIQSLYELERSNGRLQDVLSGPTAGRRFVIQKMYVPRCGFSR